MIICTVTMYYNGFWLNKSHFLTYSNLYYSYFSYILYRTDTLKNYILFKRQLSQKIRTTIKISTNQFCMLKNNWIFQCEYSTYHNKRTIVNRWVKRRIKKKNSMSGFPCNYNRSRVSPRLLFPDQELPTLKMAPVVIHEAAMINVKKHPGTVESYWDDKSWSIKGSVLKKKRGVKNEGKKYIHKASLSTSTLINNLCFDFFPPSLTDDNLWTRRNKNK